MRVKNIKDGVCPTHEIWMICVNVGILYDYQVLYHLIAGLQGFVQQAVHNIDDLLSEVLKPIKLRELNFCDYPSQFFID